MDRQTGITYIYVKDQYQKQTPEGFEIRILINTSLYFAGFNCLCRNGFLDRDFHLHCWMKCFFLKITYCIFATRWSQWNIKEAFRAAILPWLSGWLWGYQPLFPVWFGYKDCICSGNFGEPYSFLYSEIIQLHTRVKRDVLSWTLPAQRDECAECHCEWAHLGDTTECHHHKRNQVLPRSGRRESSGLGMWERVPDQSFAPGMCLYCPGPACDSVHRDLSPATPLMPSVTGPHTYCPPMASHHLTSVYLLASLLASYRPWTKILRLTKLRSGSWTFWACLIKSAFNKEFLLSHLIKNVCILRPAGW